MKKGATVLDKLNELYPSGLVLGSALAIVGDFGLTIQWDSFGKNMEQKRYEPGEEISIIQIKGDYIELATGYYPHAFIHHNHFKGIKFKTGISNLIGTGCPHFGERESFLSDGLMKR